MCRIIAVSEVDMTTRVDERETMPSAKGLGEHRHVTIPRLNDFMFALRAEKGRTQDFFGTVAEDDVSGLNG